MSTTELLSNPGTTVSTRPEQYLADTRDWVERAVGLADRVIEARKRTKSGAAAWLGPRSAGPGEANRLISLGVHLYGGTSGIALFLAAAGRISGEERLSEAAVDALEPLHRRLVGILEDETKAANAKLGAGGYHGLASLLYGLTKVGSWLDRRDFVDTAHRSTRLLPRQIEADTTYDLTFGSAGAILFLSTLERELGRESGKQLENEDGHTPVDLALLAADHLLANRVSTEAGPRAWKTMEDRPPLTGFSHGVAGIACALWQLYDQTGREDLVEAAREGLEYEAALFSGDHANWQDLRYDHPVYGETWCHGAPGVALGRAHLARFTSDEGIGRDLEIGLARCIEGGRREIDHLCCGNLGRAEILLYAGQAGGRPELVETAYEIVAETVERAEREGQFRWLRPGEGDFFDPSFFVGASGIGYTLLRFAEPEKLPSVFFLD